MPRNVAYSAFSCGETADGADRNTIIALPIDVKALIAPSSSSTRTRIPSETGAALIITWV